MLVLGPTGTNTPRVRDPEVALRTLLELTSALAGELTLDEALAAATDAALKVFQAQHSSIRILDESGTDLLCGARSGAGLEERPLSFKSGQGVVGWVVERGEPACLHDAQRDPRFVSFEQQSYTIGSLLVLPLTNLGEVIGALSVTAEDTHHFDEDDLMLGQLLANCTAGSIERARLQRLAITDAQTLSWSHAYLLPRLEEELRAASDPEPGLAVLLMDLDHFKRVNDTHGHAVGDRVLRAFADVVRQQIRRRDMLFRRGGEEFVVVMPSCTLHDAETVAERIRQALASEPLDGGEGIAVDQRVSIGVARWDGEESAAELEARADAAMYAAKREGRNQVSVAPPPLEG